MMKKLISIIFAATMLTSCGDFPNYNYEQSEELCVLSFPFAAGLIGRKYIGYFNLTSTLQFLDSEPSVEIFVSGPSHIKLEVGSLQKIEINNQVFVPKFHKNYLQAELQYWGPAFTFDQEQSAKIYQALQQGHDISFIGRVEVGEQYETSVYNFFFEDTDQPYRDCINRLLSEDDLKTLASEGNNEAGLTVEP